MIGTSQKLTVQAGWPYIRGPYKRARLYLAIIEASARLTGNNIRSPENNLKETIWSFYSPCCEVWLPCNGDKSQLVELLYNGEVPLDIFRHFMELNAYLTHIGEGSTEKQPFDNLPIFCIMNISDPLHGDFSFSLYMYLAIIEASARLTGINIRSQFVNLPIILHNEYHLLNHCNIISRSAPSTSIYKHNNSV